MRDDDSHHRPPLTTVAVFVATVGPLGRYSSRPAALASGLAASLYWFLPEPWALRALIVVIATLIAEVVSRTATAADADGDGHNTIVIDRWVGMWWAILPLRHDIILLVAAFALYRFIEGRRVAPVAWVAHRWGGPRGVVDDVVAGLLAGLPVAILDRLVALT